MTPFRANSLALFAALAWGSGNVSQKTILEHLDAFAATGIPSLIGAAFLAPLAWREAKGLLPSAKGSLSLLLVISVLFTFAVSLIQFGYGLTTVTNAGFLVNASAVMTPILSWAWFRFRPPVAIWPASLLAFFGIFLVAGANWSGLSDGDLLALLSAMAFAVWSLAAGLYVMRYRRPILMTVVQLTLCGAICIGFGGLTYDFPARGALVAAVPEILYIGLISKGVAYVLIAIAQQHISANSAGVLICAEALFGAFIATLVLGETLSLLRGTGAFCIFLGVIIAARIPAFVPGVELSARA